MSIIRCGIDPFKQPIIEKRSDKSSSFSYPINQIHRLIPIPKHYALDKQKLSLVYHSIKFQFMLITRCSNYDSLLVPVTRNDDVDNDNLSFDPDPKPKQSQGQTNDKNFWGAVSLIIGTAVGPGMLGLPAVTIRSGPLPSTVAILLSWVYVISSILLVAELSFAAMEEENVSEVSFTGLATKTLGTNFGTFVALVYASLSFSLLVACVSGIGSIVSQIFPNLNPVISNALYPFVIGIILGFFPFKTIDIANRALCFVMLFSISALVLFGLFIGRTNILSSFGHASWGLSSVLPAIPVTVLTLGFHIITPFICKIVGNSVYEARMAILFGGFVPLVMVLCWNLIVLGLAGTNTALSSKDPISLLLSVNPSALSAVQGFAFSALGTSLIGYAVSFPKQVADTFELMFKKPRSTQKSPPEVEIGSGFGLLRAFLTPLVLGTSVLIASSFPSTFSRALDFAGVYANCFLFGILPPAMTYIHHSRKKNSTSILPGGNFALLLLFLVAAVLGIWH